MSQSELVDQLWRIKRCKKKGPSSQPHNLGLIICLDLRRRLESWQNYIIDRSLAVCVCVYERTKLSLSLSLQKQIINSYKRKKNEMKTYFLGEKL